VTPPVPAAGTPPPPSHQSIVIGAVSSEPSAHSTLQFQAPTDAGGGSGAAADSAGGLGSAATAFDPNVAGALPDASDAYPGDNAPREAIAAWMARQAHKAGLPAELPIMAALTESGLKNDNYGDRDSLGFFQMRTSIWNSGDYAGFPDHPELQLKWFIDHALAVRRERITAGDTTFGQDRSKWGDWVADVERPAAEYRGRYQTHLDETDGLLSAGGPGAAGVGGAAGAPGAADAAAALQNAYMQGGYSTAGLSALQIAERYMGTPYKWGGASPETGFDCSGLVQYSYKQLGIELPRVTDQQFQVGVHIPTVDQLKPGDIVFFRDSTGYIHHEGMYIGNHMFVHAPHTGDVIKISSLDEPYYKEQFAGGSDVTGLASGAPPAAPAGVGAPPPPPPPPVDPQAADAGSSPAPAPGSGSTPDSGTGSGSGSGSGESGLFGAVPDGGSEPPPPPEPEGGAAGGGHAPPGSTVQILPAVKDPSADS
jgi:cell wall-associated NlpC family hydrolase